jgi:hypothetical protein
MTAEPTKAMSERVIALDLTLNPPFAGIGDFESWCLDSVVPGFLLSPHPDGEIEGDPMAILSQGPALGKLGLVASATEERGHVRELLRVGDRVDPVISPSEVSIAITPVKLSSA